MENNLRNWVVVVVFLSFRRKKRDPENPKLVDLNEPLYQVYTSGPMSMSYIEY